MRELRYIIPLFGMVLVVPGCGEDPGSLTGRGPRRTSSGEDGEDGNVDGGRVLASKQAGPGSFGEQVLSRAHEWIDADMPYCGGPNGGNDVLCGGKCVRTGDANNKDWDSYRSDCSGFVSWSWGLPPPGHTTYTLAPFDTSVSTEIDVSQLTLGDALNSRTHVVLWGGWVDESAGKASILEESDCGLVAHERTAKITKIDDTSVKVDGSGPFHAIRYKDAH